MRGSKGDARLQLDDFDGRSRRIDRALRRSVRPRRARARRTVPRRRPREVRRLRAIFGERFHLELQQHLTRGDAQRNQRLVQLARELHVPCVATNAVAYAVEDDAPVCRRARCVDDGTTLERARARQPPSPQRRVSSQIRRRDAAGCFAPHPEAIARTVEIADRCRFRLERTDRAVSALSGAEEGKTRAIVPARARLSRCRQAVRRRRSRSERRAPARIRARHHRRRWI